MNKKLNELRQTEPKATRQERTTN